MKKIYASVAASALLGLATPTVVSYAHTASDEQVATKTPGPKGKGHCKGQGHINAHHGQGGGHARGQYGDCDDQQTDPQNSTDVEKDPQGTEPVETGKPDDQGGKPDDEDKNKSEKDNKSNQSGDKPKGNKDHEKEGDKANCDLGDDSNREHNPNCKPGESQDENTETKSNDKGTTGTDVSGEAPGKTTTSGTKSAATANSSDVATETKGGAPKSGPTVKSSDVAGETAGTSAKAGEKVATAKSTDVSGENKSGNRGMAAQTGSSTFVYSLLCSLAFATVTAAVFAARRFVK